MSSNPPPPITHDCRDCHAAPSFPYWSPTSHKVGEPLGKPTGRCFIGLLPTMQVKKRNGEATIGAGVVNALEDIGLGVGKECTSAQACEDMSHCNGMVGVGMSLSTFCYTGWGDNACVCGVTADHITDKKMCGPGMPPPPDVADFEDREKVAKKLSEQKLEVTTGKEVASDTNTDVWWIQHKFPSIMQDWLSSKKRLPLWMDSNKKTNGEKCVEAYLPYVKCSRTFSKKMKNLFSTSPFSCSRDSDCYCKAGCGGPAIGGIWRPTCFHKTGFNVCMCALQSTTIHTEKGCSWPVAHETNINGEEVEIYYAKDEPKKPSKGSGFTKLGF